MQLEVRYTGKDDIKLRYALWVANKSNCGWCGEPLEFRDGQIDHIIPQKPPKGLTKAGVLQYYGLAPDYDVNHPRNLFVIHGECNRRKSNSLKQKSPVFMDHLDRADIRCGTVIAEVGSLRAVPDVANALISVANLRRRDARTIAVAVELGDAAAARLYALGVRFTTSTEYSAEERSEGGVSGISLELSERGRAVKLITEEMYATSWELLMLQVLDQCAALVAKDAYSDVESRVRGEVSVPTVGDPIITFLEATVRVADYRLKKRSLQVQIAGSLSASSMVSVAGLDPENDSDEFESFISAKLKGRIRLGTGQARVSRVGLQKVAE